MEKKVIYINDAQGFDRIRQNYIPEKLVIVINKDIDFKGKPFEPIELPKTEVTIIGKNKNFYNLIIDNASTPYTGIFSRVKSLSVKSLNVASSIIRGGVLSGCLVGKCEEDLVLSNCKFTSIVEAEALCGGVAGTAKNIMLDKTEVSAAVSGYDIVGGVAGIAEHYKEKDSRVFDTITSVGKCKHSTVGYCDENERARVMQMLYSALEHQPVVCTDEEMYILKMMITKKN